MGVKARPVPELRTPRLTLRPYRMEELDRALAGVRRLDAVSSPWGPPSRDKLRRRLRTSGRLWRGRVVLAMATRGGRLVGEIQTYRVKGMAAGTVGLGIMIYDPADRGRGYGSEAIPAFVGWIFDAGVASRVEAGTRPANTAMRRAFTKLGWRERGIERYRDMDWVMFETRR